MAATMQEYLKSYNRGELDDVAMKLTLVCLAHTDGLVSLPLTRAIVNKLHGWRLDKVITYPAAENAPNAESDFSIVETNVKLSFDTGTVEIVDGEVITCALTGAQGTVLDVQLTGGTWVGGDAAGSLILQQRNATAFANNDILAGSSGGAALATGADTVHRTKDILVAGGVDGIAVAAATIIHPTPQVTNHPYTPLIDKDYNYIITNENTVASGQSYIAEVYFCR